MTIIPYLGYLIIPAIRPTRHRITTTWIWNDKGVKDFLTDLQKTPWSFLDTFDDVENMYSAWDCFIK